MMWSLIGKKVMMTSERYWELETSPTAELTKEERAEGWHWCIDWDGMLVGPGMVEESGCCCE